jgi:glycosyltransferase involved in cell wall biosynthesis
MKICYLANAASIHTQRWAAHFARRGHEVTVVSLTPSSIPGVDVRLVRPDPNVRGRIAYILAVPRLRRMLRDLNPDVMHAHYAGGYGLTAALCGFHPLVLTAWGSDVLILPHASRLMRKLVQFALRRADLVTSMADHMTKTIRALGVREERVVTLPFGVDTSVFHPRTGERRRPAEGSFTIVSTRHLEPLYNVGLLVEAMPTIAAAVPKVELFLIGDGSERARLESRVRELNLAAHVFFLGRKGPAEIAEYLSDAHLFVSTSRSDGNNVSLNEAMACGAFPIATDIPANREWIEHGGNGFLTDLDDPRTLAGLAIQAYQRPALRVSAAAANWEIIRQRGSWAAQMEIMEQQYRNLILNNEPAGAIRLAEGVQQ